MLQRLQNPETECGAPDTAARKAETRQRRAFIDYATLDPARINEFAFFDPYLLRLERLLALRRFLCERRTHFLGQVRRSRQLHRPSPSVLYSRRPAHD